MVRKCAAYSSISIHYRHINTWSRNVQHNSTSWTNHPPCPSRATPSSTQFKSCMSTAMWPFYARVHIRGSGKTMKCLLLPALVSRTQSSFSSSSFGCLFLAHSLPFLLQPLLLILWLNQWMKPRMGPPPLPSLVKLQALPPLLGFQPELKSALQPEYLLLLAFKPGGMRAQKGSWSAPRSPASLFGCLLINVV